MSYFSAAELQRDVDLQNSTFDTTVSINTVVRVPNNRGSTTDSLQMVGTTTCRIAEMTRPPIDKLIADQLAGKQGYIVTYPLSGPALNLGQVIIVTASPNLTQVGVQYSIASGSSTGTYAAARRTVAYQRV